MKLLLDQNLAHRLVSALASLYPDSQHVREIGMATASDDAIWSYAREHGMAILSKDSDFYYLSLLLGQPPKVVWINMGNCSTDQIKQLLERRHEDLLAFNQDAKASVIVLNG